MKYKQLVEMFLGENDKEVESKVKAHFDGPGYNHAFNHIELAAKIGHKDSNAVHRSLESLRNQGFLQKVSKRYSVKDWKVEKSGLKEASRDDMKGTPHEHSIVHDATSNDRFEQHSRTSTEQHQSRSVRVPEEHSEGAKKTAQTVLHRNGFKHKRVNPVSGADEYEGQHHTAEVFHNNGTLHVSVKRK